MKKHRGKILLLFLATLIGLSSYAATYRARPSYAAAPASIYLSPSSASVQPGQAFSLKVRVKSTQAFNAAFVGVNFDSSAVQLTGTSTAGTGFPNNNSTPKSQSGYYYAERTKSTASGDFLFLTYNFKSLKAGSSTVSINTTSSKVINYPSSVLSFTIGNAVVTSTEPNKPPVVQPPVVQPPTTEPPDTTNPGTDGSIDTTPADTGSVSDSIVTDQSAPGPDGLTIDDFKVSDVGYKAATLSWTTTKPASSKVNFSTDENDLSSEQKDDTPTTTHTIKLSSDSLKAGTHYFARVTSDDGAGPVTVDGEFDTNAISVVVAVTDEKNQPVADADVSVGDQSETTDEKGETTLLLPEGDVTIHASKGDLSREVTTTIEIPADQTPQRITLAIGKNAAPLNLKKSKKGSSLFAILGGFVLLVLLLVGGFLFWRRRKSNGSVGYIGDPLEADNYNQAQPIPTTPDPVSTGSTPAPEPLPYNPAPITPAPEPTYQELQGPDLPHHSTLPELVGRYGAVAAPDEPTSAIPTVPVSPTGQQIPQHTSLKDLVSVDKAPATEQIQTYPILEDLPVSPVSPTTSATTQATETFMPTDQSSQPDGSLSITHAK